MSETSKILAECWINPQFESDFVSKRPLRAVQSEIIKRVENFVAEHRGGVMPIRCARQTGKNEMAAVLQRRHLWWKQDSPYLASWIRTAPTHLPQIVNSKKRLQEILRLDSKKFIHHPLLKKQKLQTVEGYIWRVGNATVEFMSSGPHSNVVGATASECLDMDEAHKVDKAKFDEDFSPFTASTNAATILWGVASDGLDTIEWYRESNHENGDDYLNLDYPYEIWAESSPQYAAHVESRIIALGPDHPIIKTQYRLISVSHEGRFINQSQSRMLFQSVHARLNASRPGATYEMVIDIAAGNEDFESEVSRDTLDTDSNESTSTDSTVIWVYEVTSEIAQNNLFPVVNLIQVYKWTGRPLPEQETAIVELIQDWRVSKVTIDGVGVGRHIAESLEAKFGAAVVEDGKLIGGMIFKYIGNSTSVSEDCFDCLARLNYGAIKMFQNDGSSEYEEFERQVGWTKYASSKGKMNLVKPQSDKHIDMVKAITYIGRNNPNSAVHSIVSVGEDE